MHIAKRSIDLHRPAFDAVHTGGAAEEVLAADDHLAGLRERDARLAAAEDDFFWSGQFEPLAVEFDLGGRIRFRSERRRGNEAAEDDRLLAIVAGKD